MRWQAELIFCPVCRRRGVIVEGMFYPHREGEPISLREAVRQGYEPYLCPGCLAVILETMGMGLLGRRYGRGSRRYRATTTTAS